MKYDIIDCRMNPEGLHLTLKDDKGARYELYGVRLHIDRMNERLDFINPLKPPLKALEVHGTFQSAHHCNRFEYGTPLKVTIEDIERKFGARVEIIGNYLNKKGR